ncbi:hypothetical protein niasHS_017620 [Heterodera schachtii]|uniref:Uncharacterized protein n=1 Tax=Heterodera schachtii TaxID=97005 RepID=A0ABD2I0Q9_HETSC
MAKTLKTFKVKASRKQLEKAKRVRRRKTNGELGTEEVAQIMETDGKAEKGATTRKNVGRLRKNEMPFVGTEKGRKNGGSLAKDSKTKAPDEAQQGVTTNRQITKKKARKVMRNRKREERKREKAVNAMETDEK